MQAFENFINYYNDTVGPMVLLALLIPVGLMFTILLKAIQFRKFGLSLRIVSGQFHKDENPGDITHFQALSAALSATVGIGNIAGVATAIAWGGPGAAFWIWMTGFLGMALKYAECTLALHYRETDSQGMVAGGPMYYIKKGLTGKLGRFAGVLAVLFAVGTVICSFGTGNMPQSNSMAQALHGAYSVPTWLSGLVIAVLVFLVIVGGIRRIGSVASKLVPFMAAFYILGGLLVLLVNYDKVGSAFALIIRDAFTGEAALKGGFIAAMIWGIKRGLYSNEAGQGSAPIAHAAAKTPYAVREGLVSMLEPFIDTVLICTLTSLVIVVGGLHAPDATGLAPQFDGAVLTTRSFESGLAPIGMAWFGQQVVAISTVLFALSTAISWSYYGDRAVTFLIDSPRAVLIYRIVFSIVIFVGAVQSMKLVWGFADMAITFMALPNLLALCMLAPKVLSLTRQYFAEMSEKADKTASAT
ncbi:sodium:alanine symporter family protein [Myxococcota bacterium]|jgi:AGCS family alanine or glycine:cation symporter|nr:sodium:alanine symporter family protein [Myxococcota bacterium]MBU1412813.1 sodium:alanine symporter family protein [Myxococcota bacterium]MBU1508883.1 sodium:alanine symporter family protein [Myxococcota bacterium]PKN27333.1 MAG: sodium:alanine symporter family protein [Deltaproteobacteria bacterium HGW-Deltaproteobacteria-22]